MKFRPDLVPATAEDVAAARDYVMQLAASGLTDIDDALTSSLDMSWNIDPSANLLIFMTDGVPTWGETESGAIVDSATAHNGGRVRILPFGIGLDISPALLDEIAVRNGGYSTYIGTGSGFAESIRQFFQRVTMPPVTDINVAVIGLTSYDRAPEIPTTAESGTQLVQFGRYTGGGDYPITGYARVEATKIYLESSGHFENIASGDRAIALLWARAKIDDLLRQISVYGEKDELVDAVIFLSVRYGILTPYTALYADPTSSSVGSGRELMLAERLALDHVAPNPFRDRTVVTWLMPQGSSRWATIEIIDITGRVVRTLLTDLVDAGLQTTEWDGRDDAGTLVASGSYVLRIRVGAEQRTQVVVVVR
jgi:hypothetical protein